MVNRSYLAEMDACQQWMVCCLREKKIGDEPLSRMLLQIDLLFHGEPFTFSHRASWL
jgi:hypothetical protein